MTLRLTHRRQKRHLQRCAQPPGPPCRPLRPMAYLVADAKAFGRSLVEHLAWIGADDAGAYIPF